MEVSREKLTEDWRKGDLEQHRCYNPFLPPQDRSRSAWLLEHTLWWATTYVSTIAEALY